MRIIHQQGRIDLAEVFVAELRDDPRYMVEMVDATGGLGGDRKDKWVIIVSSQFGCPVRCLMCDAGEDYLGNLTAEEIIAQIEYVISRHAISPRQCTKFKVQFARMGEPALNDAVLDVLAYLADRYPNVIPCIATIAPHSREKWFADLLILRDRFRDFQLQLSINTLDTVRRDILMPYPKLPLSWIAEYGRCFHRQGSRKTVLNFALSLDLPLEADRIGEFFDPAYFIIKLTPLNPTIRGQRNQLRHVAEHTAAADMLEQEAGSLSKLGYEVIVSIGELEENRIGSNCGQSVRRIKNEVYEEAAIITD